MINLIMSFRFSLHLAIERTLVVSPTRGAVLLLGLAHTRRQNRATRVDNNMSLIFHSSRETMDLRFLSTGLRITNDLFPTRLWTIAELCLEARVVQFCLRVCTKPYDRHAGPIRTLWQFLTIYIGSYGKNGNFQNDFLSFAQNFIIYYILF